MWLRPPRHLASAEATRGDCRARRAPVGAIFAGPLSLAGPALRERRTITPRRSSPAHCRGRHCAKHKPELSVIEIAPAMVASSHDDFVSHSSRAPLVPSPRRLLAAQHAAQAVVVRHPRRSGLRPCEGIVGESLNRPWRRSRRAGQRADNSEEFGQERRRPPWRRACEHDLVASSSEQVSAATRKRRSRRPGRRA